MTHKLLALALCCWYLLSVLGFDVHVCGHTGHVFIQSLLAFASSDDNCQAVNCDCSVGDCDCCHHNEADEDCEDTVEKIDIPGTHIQTVEVPAPMVAELPTPAAVDILLSVFQPSFSRDFVTEPPLPDVLSRFCVMRV